MGSLGGAVVAGQMPVVSLLAETPTAREDQLMQLQIDALLPELRSDQDGGPVQNVLESLSSVIKNIPAQEVQPSILGKHLETYPVSAQKKSIKFEAPAKVEISGAFASKTVTVPNCTMDLLVTIPSSCLLQKDHLNHHYHAKRAMYLTVIAQTLKKDKRFKDLIWEFQNSSPRKPVLIVRPRIKNSALPQGFAIRILTAIETSVFPLRKLAPDRNNLRNICNNSNEKENIELLPTPHYNTSILEDMFPMATVQALQRASSLLPEFLNASLLLKLWARRQGLLVLTSHSCEDLLPILAAHIGDTGKLTPAMSSLQIFKATMKAIADPRTFKVGIFMAKDQGAEPVQTPPPHPSTFKPAFDCILVTSNGWLNLLGNIPPSLLYQVQQKAKLASIMLEKIVSAEEVFEKLFLNDTPSPAMMDYLWRVDLPIDLQFQLDSDIAKHRMQELEVEALVKKALGDRAQLVHAFPRPLEKISSLDSIQLEHFGILVGAKVNVENAFRGVDVGPLADSAEATPFREFWGEKSEMRKFLDGRICEAVAWDVSAASRHTILDQILHYIVPKHLDARVSGNSGCLDWVLTQKQCSRDEQLAARRLADAALVKLGKQLRSLSSLPLKITSLQPISASSRHVNPFSPLPHPFAGARLHRDNPVLRCIDPLECLLQFEASGKWPDNTEAFRKMKAAMGVQTAEELFTSFGLRAEASEQCVGVFTDGFVFRLFLFSERDNAVALKDPEFAIDHSVLQNRLKHHGMMSQLAGVHPTLRATTELAIRWTHSHLMSNHLAQEAVELIAASPYSLASPAPGSPLAGFMAFLNVLASHPWKDRPLVVDPEHSMDISQQKAAVLSFQNAQKDGFAPAIGIATILDPASSHWTATSPSQQSRRRLVALAKRSLTIIQDQCWNLNLVKEEKFVLGAWNAGLADFDAVILLRKAAIPNSDVALSTPDGKGQLTEKLLSVAGFQPDDTSAIEPSKHSKVALKEIPPKVLKEWGTMRIQQELVVGFQPVASYVDLLEQRFSHLAHFFYDRLGGSIIAIKWIPQAFMAHAISAESAHTAVPISYSPLSSDRPRKKHKSGHSQIESICIPSLPRIVTDIQELGAGLVSQICLKRTPTA